VHPTSGLDRPLEARPVAVGQGAHEQEVRTMLVPELQLAVAGLGALACVAHEPTHGPGDSCVRDQRLGVERVVALSDCNQGFHSVSWGSTMRT
jgi:hypothetical protein